MSVYLPTVLKFSPYTTCACTRIDRPARSKGGKRQLALKPSNGAFYACKISWKSHLRAPIFLHSTPFNWYYLLKKYIQTCVRSRVGSMPEIAYFPQFGVDCPLFYFYGTTFLELSTHDNWGNASHKTPLSQNRCKPLSCCNNYLGIIMRATQLYKTWAHILVEFREENGGTPYSSTEPYKD